MDLGNGVLLHPEWDEDKKIYVDEMGVTTMDLLLQIANNEVKINGKLVKLYVK